MDTIDESRILTSLRYAPSSSKLPKEVVITVLATLSTYLDIHKNTNDYSNKVDDLDIDI